MSSLLFTLALKHFRHFLEGREVFILTDHKPLTYAMKSASSAHTLLEIRQMSYISEFSADICHIKGTANTAADALS